MKLREAYTLPVVLLTSLFLLLTGCGTGNDATTAVRDDDPVRQFTFLWEVNSPTATVYLLGSIHMAREDLYPLDAAIEDAYRSSDYLVVEVDEATMDGQRMAQLFLETAVYPEGETLPDHMPDDLYIRLSEALDRLGVMVEIYDPYRPWFVSVSLEQLQLYDLDYHTSFGIDRHFLDAARASDKEILQLEDAELQYDLFASIPDEDMLLILKEDVDNPPTEADMAEFFRIWETGDAAAMEQEIFESLEAEPRLDEFYRKLIDDRNYGMLEKIEGYLSGNGTYFVIAGAGHLVGEVGLVNLLEEGGYGVEQVEAAGIPAALPE